MTTSSATQMLLFDPHALPVQHRAILGHYASAKELSVAQDDLYEAEACRRGIDIGSMKARVAIGTSAKEHAPATRQIRWWQQDLKAKGWLEPVPGHRGLWRLTEPARMALTPQQPGCVMMGVSTELGVALWANAEDVFERLDQPITLVLTSPPYPLATPRAYGNVPLARYVEWLVGMLEPMGPQACHVSLCMRVEDAQSVLRTVPAYRFSSCIDLHPADDCGVVRATYKLMACDQDNLFPKSNTPTAKAQLRDENLYPETANL